MKQQIESNLAGEEWRPIDGFPRYEVSNMGRFRTIAGRIRKLGIKKHGYGLAVMIGPDGKTYARNIHRLVAIAFVPNPLALPVVNHRDANPSNNCADNLEWTTQKENIRLAMAVRGNWLKLATRRKKAIIRVSDSGERVSFESIRAACEAINAMTVAAGGIAREVAKLAPNICHARDEGGRAYGFRWEAK